MLRKKTGRTEVVSVKDERVEAYIPYQLPPEPEVEWRSDLQKLFDQAHLSLGELNAINEIVPNTHLFLYMYVRKEAVLSSQIEGTQSSLSDLLTHEVGEAVPVPQEDVAEVSNYIAALNHGLKRMQEDDFPLSLRLLKEMHEILLRSGRGKDKAPGEYRRAQNWVGGTRPGNAIFIPPPHNQLMELMGDLEKFLHNDGIPPLLKAALAHLQFETIHPHLDGNGRLGRLMITLILCAEGLLKQPSLYLSLYFKTYRQQYYDMLDMVRRNGDWETWLAFFAEAVVRTADQAVLTAKELQTMVAKDEAIIEGLGKAKKTAKAIHNVLLAQPITTPTSLVEATGKTHATVNSSLRNLELIGIVKEVSGRKRNRVYAYSEYIRIMDMGLDIPGEHVV
ncbi:MAG: Fic family protein [Pseudodesulfovibrio sp.]|nr:Fic family protein [Pseudodesulfovibrio sp.]